MNKYFRMRCLKAEIYFGPQLRPKIGSSFLEDILGMEFITRWEIHATFSQPLVIKIDFLILSSISLKFSYLKLNYVLLCPLWCFGCNAWSCSV